MLGGAGGTGRSTALFIQDYRGDGYGDKWGTPHPGTGQFVFADGSVHGLTVSISGGVLSLLLSPSNQNPDPEWRLLRLSAKTSRARASTLARFISFLSFISDTRLCRSGRLIVSGCLPLFSSPFAAARRDLPVWCPSPGKSNVAASPWKGYRHVHPRSGEKFARSKHHGPNGRCGFLSAPHAAWGRSVAGRVSRHGHASTPAKKRRSRPSIRGSTPRR